MAGAWARPRKGSAQSNSEGNRPLAAGYQMMRPFTRALLANRTTGTIASIA